MNFIKKGKLQFSHHLSIDLNTIPDLLKNQFFYDFFSNKNSTEKGKQANKIKPG